MAKRSDRKFRLLERHQRLTPEVRNRLEQRKAFLRKELDYVDGLLEKLTLKVRKELK